MAENGKGTNMVPVVLIAGAVLAGAAQATTKLKTLPRLVIRGE